MQEYRCFCFLGVLKTKPYTAQGIVDRPIFKVMEFEQQPQQTPKENSHMNIAAEQKLSPKQVAALYGVSTAQLCVWRKNKLGPAYMQPVPRKVIYLLSDVEQYFKKLRVETRQLSHASK